MSLLEKEKTGKKIIDLRLKLRNEIRKLIDRIVIYPVGLHFVTREFAQKALEDLSEFFQEGTKEYSDINMIVLNTLKNFVYSKSFLNQVAFAQFTQHESN